ncbi:MAG: von Willebrand factor type A domain-containing protein, partial [Vicinamibacterales bacterium]
MRVLTALVLFVGLFVAGPVGLRSERTVPAQGRTISGTVLDPAGGALPGVTVELRQGERVLQRTTSDATGAWTFANVQAGDVRVRLALAGFVTTEVVLKVGESDPAPLRVVLKVGVASEVVTVTAGMEVVDTQATRIGGVPGGVLGGVVGGLPNAPPPPGSAAAKSVGTGQGGGRGGGYYPPRYMMEVQRDTASYAEIVESRFRSVTDHPLSTFSVDVDTASYANVRRFLNEGRIPPPDAVRIEELINYFKYDYPAPRGDAPVSITTEVAACPWNPKHRLALVGLRAKPIDTGKTPPRNLTFLLDVSGSMAPPNRLPLVKTAMQMLVDTLRPEDRVGIVVYSGNSGLALKPTSGDKKAIINHAIEELRAGGSTNGASGIQLAYDLATENFVKGGVNRVILATDGDFNVGVTSHADLMRMIEAKRERGIFLSVLGVGESNLKDSTMEMLADKGNGNYSYLDSIQEARRVLIAEAGSTLVTVAKDVKLQIEFNPRFAAAYRLIGYENRILRKEDFNNDRKDAGEMGAGHTVTALYEIVPAGQEIPDGGVDPLKYQQPVDPPARTIAANSTELMNIKVRYKAPDGDASKLLEFPVREHGQRMTANLGFAAAVAEFGLLIRRSDFRGDATWEQVLSLARAHRGKDPDGYRAEFARLADLAAALDRRRTTT